MAPSKKLRANDLAQRHGSALGDLAALEELGLLKPRQDDQGPYYSSGDEVRLQIALKSMRLGFSMREIAAMIAIVAGTSIAAFMVHLSSLCRICLKTGAPYADVFFRTVI